MSCQLAFPLEAPGAIDPIADLVARGALFAVHHSGGKDSQAMLLHVLERVPADQVAVFHAVLVDVAAEDSLDHIRATTPAGIPIVEAHPAKTFFDQVDHRGMFPSPSIRQCTSDLKRTPLEREVRRFLAANPRFGGLVVNCSGQRAEESSQRAKLRPFTRSERNSKAGRQWFDWHPIHDWLELQVFTRIAAADQAPHWSYAAGMSRHSCWFCIMASDADLTKAAELKPDLYRRYCRKEAELGFTLSMSRRTLPEITGINPD